MNSQLASFPWRTASLGDLTASTRPICYGVLKPGEHKPDGVPLIRIVDIAGDRLDLSGAHRISAQLDAEFERSRLTGGEVLLSIQGTIGRVAIAPPNAAGANISRTIAVIDVDDRAMPEFVRYWLMWAGATNQFKVGGTTRNSLNIGDIRQMPCPLPALEEQCAIVEVLEEHLSRIEAALTSVKVVRSKANQLRRSLLHAAVTGALTGAASADGSTPDDWRCVRLDRVADVRLGRQRSPKNHSGQLMRPYLRAANVTWAGLALHDVKEMNFTEAEMQTFRLLPGDVVVNEASGSPREVGKAAIFRGEITDCAFQNTLLRVRPLTDSTTEYLHLYLTYLALTGAHLEDARGVGIAHLGRAKLAAREVLIPPVEIQREVVTAVEGQVASLDRSIAAADRAESICKALRRSLLHAAFAGKLTEEWRKTHV